MSPKKNVLEEYKKVIRRGCYRRKLKKRIESMNTLSKRRNEVKNVVNVPKEDSEEECIFNFDCALASTSSFILPDDCSPTMNWIESYSDTEDNVNDVYDTETWETRDRFRAKLAEWATSNHINKEQLRNLLKVCNETLPFTLPSDPRTIVGTPRSIILKTYEDGSQYWHHGIRDSLLRSLTSVVKELPDVLSININMDGLPIGESTNEQFWPILANIHELHYIEPIVVGIYRGNSE